MAEDQDKKEEEKFEFTPEGEVLGYRIERGPLTAAPSPWPSPHPASRCGYGLLPVIGATVALKECWPYTPYVLGVGHGRARSFPLGHCWAG